MEKKENKFIDNYFNDYNKLLLSNFDEVKKKLILIKKNFLQIKKNKKKIIIFGNGGSAAISSHFSVDMTKNANIRCINFNEPDLITCFSNDFGYENWLSNSIKFYGDKGDILIAISSSGKSKNIINGYIPEPLGLLNQLNIVFIVPSSTIGGIPIEPAAPHALHE